MTIIEAINYIDNIKPNAYSQSEKVGWLSQLDGRIMTDIVETHEGGESVAFEGYDDETAIDTKLLIPHPYTEVYLYWLEAKIDYANGEYKRYNISISMFNTAYSAYENHYNRTHMPLGKKFKFF